MLFSHEQLQEIVLGRCVFVANPLAHDLKRLNHVYGNVEYHVIYVDERRFNSIYTPYTGVLCYVLLVWILIWFFSCVCVTLMASAARFRSGSVERLLSLFFREGNRCRQYQMIIVLVFLLNECMTTLKTNLIPIYLHHIAFTDLQFSWKNIALFPALVDIYFNEYVLHFKFLAAKSKNIKR